jgi:hypothetical protein
MPDIGRRLVCRQVRALTFASLCRAHGLDRVDLLVIDTEGHDGEIVRSLDLTERRPLLLVFEHFHLDPDDRAAARAHLEAHGYRLLEEGFDTVGLHADADPRLQRVFGRLRPAVGGVSVHDEDPGEPEPHPDLVRLTPEDRRYLTSLYDDSVPLPDAAAQLTPDNPRLVELRERYAALDLPVLDASRWRPEAVADFLDLRWFRGETLITWHYRELPRISALKFFVLARYVRDRDTLGLLDRLARTGAFGCWTSAIPGHRTYSRDLLESANELLFLERAPRRLEAARRCACSTSARATGAFAHRFARPIPTSATYCCVDAVPESTFLSDYYLGSAARAARPRRAARPLDAELARRRFDLAVTSTRSRSAPSRPSRGGSTSSPGCESRGCSRARRADRAADARGRRAAAATSPAARTRGLSACASRAGHRRPAVRELMRLDDHFHLYERDDAASGDAARRLRGRGRLRRAQRRDAALGRHTRGAAPVHVHYLHGRRSRRARCAGSPHGPPRGADADRYAIAPERVARLPRGRGVHGGHVVPDLAARAGARPSACCTSTSTRSPSRLAPLWATDSRPPPRRGDQRAHAPPRAPARVAGPRARAYFNSGVLLMNLDRCARTAHRRAARLRRRARRRARVARPGRAQPRPRGRRLALHPRWNAMNSLRFPWAADVFGASVVAEARGAPGIRHFEARRQQAVASGVRGRRPRALRRAPAPDAVRPAPHRAPPRSAARVAVTRLRRGAGSWPLVALWGALLLWSLVPLALLALQVLRFGGVLRARTACSRAPTSSSTSCSCGSRARTAHSNEYRLGDSNGVYLHPMHLLSGLLWRLGVGLQLAPADWTGRGPRSPPASGLFCGRFLSGRAGSSPWSSRSSTCRRSCRC